VNKKQIIIMAGIGLIFFALSFTVGLFTRSPEEEVVKDGIVPGSEPVEVLGDNSDPAVTNNEDVAAASNAFQGKQANLNKSLTVKQLKDLIFEMRSRLTEFTQKEKLLTEKEGRINTTLEDLQKNIEDMEKLRVKLAAQVTSIKQQQMVLDQKLVKIEAVEMRNILKTASIYDKMKTAQASEIMINLTKSNQLDFAVKIAYYMTERTSANLLAEITKKNAPLAATISDKLRWIEEVVEGQE
jgi:hypothetical protein